MMRKFIIGVYLITFLFFSPNLFGQDLPPEDGSGESLDEVPIDGNIYFILAALGIGGVLLFKKQKNQTIECDKK